MKLLKHEVPQKETTQNTILSIPVIQTLFDLFFGTSS